MRVYTQTTRQHDFEKIGRFGRSVTDWLSSSYQFYYPKHWERIRIKSPTKWWIQETPNTTHSVIKQTYLLGIVNDFVVVLCNKLRVVRQEIHPILSTEYNSTVVLTSSRRLFLVMLMWCRPSCQDCVCLSCCSIVFLSTWLLLWKYLAPSFPSSSLLLPSGLVFYSCVSKWCRDRILCVSECSHHLMTRQWYNTCDEWRFVFVTVEWSSNLKVSKTWSSDWLYDR
jgi:hypothetical protein